MPPSTSKSAANTAPQTLWLYQAQKTIHPRSVSGWFTSWRWVFVWLTQLLFYGLPWLMPCSC